MSIIGVGIGITSITFSDVGVIAVNPATGVSALISAADGTSDSDESKWESPVMSSTNSANGNMVVNLPAVITSITVNGNVYNASGGNPNSISNVLPADANVLNLPWYLVTG